MEKEPIRVRLSNHKGRFGRLVLQKLEGFDDAHDVFGDDEPLFALDDTQELNMEAVFNSEQFVRGEE